MDTPLHDVRLEDAGMVMVMIDPEGREISIPRHELLGWDRPADLVTLQGVFRLKFAARLLVRLFVSAKRNKRFRQEQEANRHGGEVHILRQHFRDYTEPELETQG